MSRKIEKPSRKSRKNTPRPVFIIVCDGTKTEPKYFENFNKRHKPLHVKVVPGGRNYLDLIKKGNRAKSNIEGICHVWCVSDVDADPNTPNYESAKNEQLKEFSKQAQEYGFNIALSNPCFELWYLLHFGYFTSKMPTYKSVEQKLSNPAYLPSYDKTKDYFNDLHERIEDAISNATKLKKYHEDLGVSNFTAVSANPYTDVWRLVEKIN